MTENNSRLLYAGFAARLEDFNVTSRSSFLISWTLCLCCFAFVFILYVLCAVKKIYLALPNLKPIYLKDLNPHFKFGAPRPSA